MGSTSNIRDLYAVLGISVYATPDEIRRAFRRLAHRYHPDKLQEAATEHPQFQAVLEAYRILSDAASRRQYNRQFHGAIFADECIGLAELEDQVREFHSWIQQIDPFRYDADAVEQHFTRLLQHAERLMHEDEMPAGRTSLLAAQLLPGLELLPHSTLRKASLGLAKMAEPDAQLIKRIHHRAKWIPFWQSNRLPVWLALLITLVLGWLLFMQMPS